MPLAVEKPALHRGRWARVTSRHDGRPRCRRSFAGWGGMSAVAINSIPVLSAHSPKRVVAVPRRIPTGLPARWPSCHPPRRHPPSHPTHPLQLATKSARGCGCGSGQRVMLAPDVAAATRGLWTTGVGGRGGCVRGA